MDENNNQMQIIYDPYEEEEKKYVFDINKNKYISNAYINKGSLGPIGSFYLTNSEELVSIKKIENAYESPSKGKNVLKLLSISSFTNHPNIIKLLDIIIPEKEEYQDIYLIEEYMGTNLEKLVVSKEIGYKDKNLLYPWIIYQLLRGLHYLHSCKIMHRDIKSSKILLDEKGKIKICGFGNAISFDDYENTTKGEINDFITEKGVLTYRAPELLSNKKKGINSYDEKIDIWGVGCIMAELYTNINPFFPSAKNDKKKWVSQLSGIFKKLGKPSKQDIQEFASSERIKDILKFHSYPKLENSELFPNVDDDNAIDLMQKFLCINPKKRISIKEAINHPYFNVIEEYKNKDDFMDSSEIYTNEYKEKIKEMEKKNAYFQDQIKFYKEEILLKQKSFQNNKK